jgi:predicted component of type VI protein secretion system
MLLAITIRNLDSGISTRFESAQSPVRIGRNALNELVLEAGFVSQFHGVVRFGDDGIHYKDLGSTNGSTVAGRRLTRNAEVALGPESDLRIGPLRLEIAVKAASAADGSTPPGAGIKHTRTLYGMLRESPDGAPRGARANAAPMSEGASVATTPLSSNARSAADATSIARELASRLLPPGREPTNDVDARRLIEAVAVILDAFAHSFVGLRRGVEQAGSELGVRSVPSRSPLYIAKDHQQVLSHLLDTRTEPQLMAQELVGVFADFGVHQVALLNGITESVRALLVRVSGGDGAQERSGRVKLWPFRGDEPKVSETIRELLEDDRQLHAAIFGEEFGMAYAAGTLNDNSKGKP